MSERSVVEHALTVYYDGNARTARAALAQHDQAEKAALLAEVGRLTAEIDQAQATAPGPDTPAGGRADAATGGEQR